MTGNPNLDKIIMFLNAAIVAGSAGLVFYSHSLLKAPDANPGREFGNLVESSMIELQKTPLTMEEIVVNLYSRERRLRFLNTQMNIELFQEKDREEVAGMKVHIFDAIIDIAGNMRPKELNSITGRILLETRIKKRINKYAHKSLIKKIYFSKFIVQ
jgi:flagellar FliL protein